MLEPFIASHVRSGYCLLDKYHKVALYYSCLGPLVFEETEEINHFTANKASVCVQLIIIMYEPLSYLGVNMSFYVQYEPRIKLIVHSYFDVVCCDVSFYVHFT